jgi:hypothetical protein
VVTISVPDTVLPVTSLLALRFPFWLAVCAVIHRLDHILKNKNERKKKAIVHFFLSFIPFTISFSLVALFLIFF